MGQSPSTSSSSLELNHHESATCEALEAGLMLDLPPPLEDGFLAGVEDVDLPGDDSGDGGLGCDYSNDLPDECLAHIFHFLNPGDRKRSSLVCRRWLAVDGESRHRLSLDAQSGLTHYIPLIFSRFDSVTKLSLRCDRWSISINDDALILIAIKCPSLSRLKLRGCRELTDLGMAVFAQYAKSLRKFSCGSCSLGAKAINAILDHCTSLEAISIKRLRGIHDGGELIGPGIAAKSLRSICLQEIIHRRCFSPLIIGAKNLKTLKLIRCLGNWDTVLQTVGRSNLGLIEIHLERIQVTDLGLEGMSGCKGIETLYLVKVPECTNSGLYSVAESCRQLRKLYIDGWRINRIGDEGLLGIAKNSTNLHELVLIGVNATNSSLSMIASNCQKLERLALCSSNTIRDAEIACIGTKCESLRKLCIKGCPITDVGIESLALGCPNLIKIKVRKCRGVSIQVAEWLRERKRSLIFNIDVEAEDEDLVSETAMDTSSNDRLTAFRAKFGIFASRNLVACTLRRWSNGDNSSNGNL